MKFLLVLLTVFTAGYSNAQTLEKLKNEEIQIAIIKITSSKCEIYYGDGTGEVVDVDTKKAKELEIDAEERNIVMLTNTFLVNGWVIQEVVNSAGSQYQTSKPAYFIMVRK